ncbi:MAG: arginase [Thermodesulfobacteriota bacterium]
MHIDLIGFPMDLGADRRGVGMGAAALRIAGIRDKLEGLGYTVDDLGDVLVPNREDQAVDNPQLKFLPQIVAASRSLAALVEASLMQSHLPLCLGGDHSIALGSIAGLAAACRRKELTPGLIWIDAHPDVNSDQTTPSGNIHGMPLSASLGLGHPDLVKLFGPSPKIRPENCALIGVRSIDHLERHNIQKIGTSIFTMTDIDRQGIGPVIGQALNRMAGRIDCLHVSFDLDSLDPSVAPGVGTPVPGGLTYREAHLIMESVAESGLISSMDVAEVNPVLDVKNQSAEAAAKIVASCLGKRIL